MPTPPQSERLQKVLAAAGFGSRRSCEELIELGRVTVDGQVADQLGTRVDPRRQEICVDGEPVAAEKKVYWWLNKPAGVLCTSHDPEGRPTVLDFLPDVGARLYPVGRLDEDSTGLILLTNDGALADRLTHPRFGVPKTYEVLVAGRIPQEVIKKLCEGIWLADGRVRAAAIHRLGTKGEATKLRVILREGHNREIRRMFARFGHKVMTLERIAIGPIKIRRLGRGDARPATADEIALLRETAMASQPLPKSTPPEPKKPRRPEAKRDGNAPSPANTGKRRPNARPGKNAAPRRRKK